jgi:TRAP-type C4-dicarboxylate transport system permease small subunit
MSGFITMCKKISGWMNNLAGFVLFFMMMLTVVDVVLRFFGTAIVGTYELVAVAGAIVIGFAVPATSLDRAHVYVDFLIEGRSRAVRNGFFIATRILGIALFGLLSYRLCLKGFHLYKSGEVSLTLHIPYFPAAFGLAFCFFIQFFALISDIFSIYTVGKENE